MGSIPLVTAFIRLMWCWNCITYNDPLICQRVEGLTLDYVNKTEGIHWRKKKYQVTISDSAEAQARKSCFCLIGFLSSVQWLKLKPVFNLLLYCQWKHLERLLLRWPLSVKCWWTSRASSASSGLLDNDIGVTCYIICSRYFLTLLQCRRFTILKGDRRFGIPN